MLKCKICEEDIHEDKLGNHSIKCKDVAVLKEELVGIRIKMESYEEQAIQMKNSLEMNAARQKRMHQKKISRTTTPGGALYSPGSKAFQVDSFSSHPFVRSGSMGGSDFDFNTSEDDATPARVQRMSFTLEPNAEPVKKMSPEEYAKFIDEVKKSIFALKKVLHYAHKIVERCLDIGQLDDPDRVAENEMEIIYEQIVDSKVSEFIHDFKHDLSVYINKKAQYKADQKKLSQIGYNKTLENVKQKLKSLKTDLPKNFIKPGPIIPNRFKEDDSFSSSRDASKSPSSSNKKITIKGLAAISDFASPTFSPYVGKRTLNKQNGINQLQSPLLTTLCGASRSGLSSPKSEFSRQLLQNNSNHIAYTGVFPLSRKNTDESNMSTKDKIKFMLTREGSTSDFKSSSPRVSNSLVSSPRTNNSPRTLSSQVNSPGGSALLSPHGSKLTLKKEKSQFGRRSQFAASNAGIFGTNKVIGSPETPTIKEEKNEKSDVEVTRSKAKKRSLSMDLLKSLHREEDTNIPKFPSLLMGGISSMATPRLTGQTSANMSNSGTFVQSVAGETELTKSGKMKKKKAEEFNSIAPWESPSMRGYYSDSNRKNKRNLPLAGLNQISIEDFKFKKFLGKGAYGTVWLVEKIATGDCYAMKIVESANRFTQNRKSALKAEKDIYEVLQGDCVVKAIWTFNHEDHICFVTEYMVGGDFNRIIEKMGRLDTDQAQFYFAELVLAVESLHNMGIVHRDLKPDNILLDAKGHIRLTDFGLSERGLNILRGNSTPSGKRSIMGSPVQNKDNVQNSPAFLSKFQHLSTNKPEKFGLKVKSSKKKGEAIFDFLENQYTPIDTKRAIIKQSIKETVHVQDKKIRIIGTPDYMAPEVIDPDRLNGQPYNDRCMDLWSLGVILYEFFVGIPAFNDDSREKIFDNIQKFNLAWPPIGYDEDEVPPEAIDLMKQLMNPDPKKRIGANGMQEIKNHAFFANFDWEGLREREAPIIPCSLDDSANNTEESTREEEPVNPFSNVGDKKKNKMEKASKESELSAFRMNRVDVLHKMNQDHVKKLMKQKSVSGKLC